MYLTVIAKYSKVNEDFEDDWGITKNNHPSIWRHVVNLFSSLANHSTSYLSICPAIGQTRNFGSKFACFEEKKNRLCAPFIIFFHIFCLFY